MTTSPLSKWLFRTAAARLWWPGYLDLGHADYAAKVAEDGWHMFDLNEDGSFIQVQGEYVVAWDHDPISRATAHYPLAARIDGSICSYCGDRWDTERDA